MFDGVFLTIWCKRTYEMVDAWKALGALWNILMEVAKKGGREKYFWWGCLTILLK